MYSRIKIIIIILYQIILWLFHISDILLRETSHSVRKAGFKIVEYCNDNNWATLCDNNFTAADAKVVCRQAGYTGDSVIIFNSCIH